jgi:arsenate reductase (thioredoxin)
VPSQPRSRKRVSSSPPADEQATHPYCLHGKLCAESDAEGLLRHDAGDRFDIASAGTQPGNVRPEAIAVMKEVSIDISGHRSKSVDEFAGQGQSFDLVLTVCDSAREMCPVLPGHATRMHRAFTDPAAVQGSEAERLEVFRRVRDEVRAFLRELAESK